MTIEEAKHKLDFMKKAYQKLIDEKVDSGKLIGDGVSGEWKTETPLDEAYKSMIDALEMAIKALEQEPCDDCISRQAVLEAFGLSEKSRKYGGDHSGYETLMKYEIQDILEDLPSVTTQPKTGHWITARTCMHDGEYYCDKCLCDAPNDEKWDYCPNCGAKMEVEK